MKSSCDNSRARLNEMERSHWWHRSRRSIVDAVFWEKIKKPGKKPKILSVGCSTGAELEFLQNYGDLTAIDIDDDAIAYCREKGFDVQNVDITRNDFGNESFDIIMAMDVLEHIPDDKKAVEEIHRILKKGGSLLVTVPAFMWLWSKHDELGNSPHQRRYDKKGLCKLLAPFTVTKISYYNFILFSALLLTRKVFSRNGEDGWAIPQKRLNDLLYVIFQSEKHFLKYINFPWGGSLLAIAQKL